MIAAARRPVIGITAGVDEMTAGPWVEDTAGVPAHYVAAVQRAGGRAVLLAPDAVDAADPADLLSTLDGVVLTGSAGDVDAARYGAAPHAEGVPVAPDRDAFELAVARGAAAGGVPVLGICRGFQVINVAFGGTLHQHLPDVLGHDEHRGGPGQYTTHQVFLTPDSLAARAAGSERVTVRSYHHQGADRLGEGLIATGWSAIDGDLVEAIERPGEGFVLGVLWHPEEDPRSPVIGALVGAAGG